MALQVEGLEPTHEALRHRRWGEVVFARELLSCPEGVPTLRPPARDLMPTDTTIEGPSNSKKVWNARSRLRRGRSFKQMPMLMYQHQQLLRYKS